MIVHFERSIIGAGFTPPLASVTSGPAIPLLAGPNLLWPQAPRASALFYNFAAADIERSDCIYCMLGLSRRIGARLISSRRGDLSHETPAQPRCPQCGPPA
ncbi:MAG: hypothetical protein C0476_05030 [Sphingomonas sp.]|nr:hypothetical protein [Sphingomonas sp.]